MSDGQSTFIGRENHNNRVILVMRRAKLYRKQRFVSTLVCYLLIRCNSRVKGGGLKTLVFNVLPALGVGPWSFVPPQGMQYCLLATNANCRSELLQAQ